LHDPLRRFGLCSTTFAGNDDALVLLVAVHVVIGRLGDGEYVRWDFKSVLAAIGRQDSWGIDAKISEWVDGDQHMGNVRLFNIMISAVVFEGGVNETHIDLGRLKSLSQILIDGLVADSRKQCHIANSDLLLFERLFPICLDDSFTAPARTRGKLSGGSRLSRLLSSSFRDSLYDFQKLQSALLVPLQRRSSLTMINLHLELNFRG